MDLFMEYLVQHRRSGKDLLATVGIIAGAAILLVLSTALWSVPILSNFWPIIVFAIIFFAVILIKKMYVEYEYILTNNELDIDKITSRSNRKKVITINFLNIDICAPVTNEQYKTTNNAVKVYDCTGDGLNGVYFIDFSDEQGAKRVLFQPPVSYIEKVKRFNPSKIFID